MKNLLTFATIIFSIHTFSQDDLKNTRIDDFFNATKIEEDHCMVQDILQKLNFELIEEIKLSEDLKKHPIAERKFVLIQKQHSIFGEKIKENLNDEKKSSTSESLMVEMNDDFMENVLIKVYIENDKIQEIITNETKNFDGRTFKSVSNHLDLENKLLITYILHKNLNIQIGNSIFPYLNKLHKTDIEKTLNTSLNLLAVNF